MTWTKITFRSGRSNWNLQGKGQIHELDQDFASTRFVARGAGKNWQRTLETNDFSAAQAFVAALPEQPNYLWQEKRGVEIA